ncbi:SH2 domain-containing adapter protein D isoform X1 [Mus musculus]|uniref:Isoform 2 of SH2 domain-containing adapter protein D n=2 Tax=Mus musculus TaxID=10090 RepID=O88834-2|nr:SH2 domain-containing adapter protein D isoform 1 [Mus musculus]NP_001397594.1 SH2 domain-containing adapter protein D isoform 1 [Mus musculus]XP_011244636.1 SH2 domain-containing adapter protein D isoform X1 [Mus musculus]AAI03799.1 Src homology 2 domain-containing transforming protein D [Mus musculus]EDL23696.1 src homology 2 domain-containing transforming protein D, isoform CRA_b [Mus musculus]|eukprot:NP_001152995.1 SH2 domain-containing adapter protein D isoform 1 [Mus musculus]
MAKWLRDYLNLGSRRPPPQPPTPDYTESDILRAYREQKDLDFEDPYEDSNGRAEPEVTGSGDPKYNSPRHRLIKVEAADMARAKALLGSPGEEQPEAETEYSDPFDAQPQPPAPNSGYMEPYDARSVSSEQPSRAVQLYDTPYEEQATKPEDGGSSGQSRRPLEDERPADEYDQPWEWKKDHISRAFAVQFDGPDWERTPCSTKEPWRPQPAERVDTALALEKQPWFHGPLSRAEAENLLSLCKEGSYLVRLSETRAQDCILSLRSNQGSMHLKFARTRENQVVLGQHSGPFPSIPELVLHYSARPLPVQGAEHLALLYPVTSSQSSQGPCTLAAKPERGQGDP